MVFILSSVLCHPLSYLALVLISFWERLGIKLVLPSGAIGSVLQHVLMLTM